MKPGCSWISLEPEQAIRRLTEFTFDYDHAHPDFVRLVAIENIHHARHLAKSTKIRKVNATIVDTIESILQRGRRERDVCGWRAARSMCTC